MGCISPRTNLVDGKTYGLSQVMGYLKYGFMAGSTVLHSHLHGYTHSHNIQAWRRRATSQTFDGGIRVLIREHVSRLIVPHPISAWFGQAPLHWGCTPRPRRLWLLCGLPRAWS